MKNAALVRYMRDRPFEHKKPVTVWDLKLGEVYEIRYARNLPDRHLAYGPDHPWEVCIITKCPGRVRFQRYDGIYAAQTFEFIDSAGVVQTLDVSANSFQIRELEPRSSDD